MCEKKVWKPEWRKKAFCIYNEKYFNILINDWKKYSNTNNNKEAELIHIFQVSLKIKMLR